MEYTIRPFPFSLRDASGKLADGRGRSKGLHLSEIIRHIQNTAYGAGWREEVIDSAGNREPLPREAVARMLLGFVIERALRDYLGYGADNIKEQQELFRDGIYLTQDFFETGVDRTYIEVKATWRSMSKLDALEVEFKAWMWQMMAHCWCAKTTHGRLIVYFVNGDYKRGQDSGGPQLIQIDLEFTKAELKENWRMLVNNGRDLLAKRERDKQVKPASASVGASASSLPGALPHQRDPNSRPGRLK